MEKASSRSVRISRKAVVGMDYLFYSYIPSAHPLCQILEYANVVREFVFDKSNLFAARDIYVSAVCTRAVKHGFVALNLPALD